MLKITEERMSQGMSMSGLARRAEMHASTVSQIENKRMVPYPGQKEKLAKALDWEGDPDLLFVEIGG